MDKHWNRLKINYLSHTRHQCRCILGLVLKIGFNFSSFSIITSDSVNSRFFQCQSKLGIDIVLILFQMFPHLDCSLDQVKEIFWDLWCASLFLQNSMNFLSSYKSDLIDAILVSEDNTYLTLRVSFFGILNNQIDNFRRGHHLNFNWFSYIG